MKKAEYILLGFSLVSIVINFMLIPGGELLTLLSLLALSMFYMFFSFMLFNDMRLKDLSDKTIMSELSIWRIMGSILSGVALSCAIIGLLFNLQQYPGAYIMSYFGWAGLLIAVTLAAIRYTQTKSTFYKRFLPRAISFFFLMFFIILMPRETLFKIKYRNHPDYVKAHMELIEDPDNEALWEKEGEERKKAHGID